MTWKVGVTVNLDGHGTQTLWTLNYSGNDIRYFDTKEEADAYGELVWPNAWTTEEVLGPETTDLEEKEPNTKTT